MSGNIHDTNPSQVLRDVMAMRKDIDKHGKKPRDYYYNKYECLSTFPYLLDTVLEGMTSEDMTQLHTILGDVSNIQKGVYTQEELSVIRGKALADKYIHPVVGEPENQVSLSEAKAQLKASLKTMKAPKGSIPLKKYMSESTQQQQ